MSSDREPKSQHPEGLPQNTETLILQLYRLGMIQFGQFSIKLNKANPDAPLSPIYVNLRPLRRFLRAKLSAVNVLAELIAPLEFDFVADVPTAATPLVSSLSDKIGVGMITPRLDHKDYGDKASVDGVSGFPLFRNRVVLVDDVITSGVSKFEAISVLKQEGLVVSDIVVLLDRGQGGKGQLESHGYRVHPAFTMSQMLDFCLRVGEIGKEQYDQVSEGLRKLNDYLQLSDASGRE